MDNFSVTFPALVKSKLPSISDVPIFFVQLLPHFEILSALHFWLSFDSRFQILDFQLFRRAREFVDWALFSFFARLETRFRDERVLASFRRRIWSSHPFFKRLKAILIVSFLPFDIGLLNFLREIFYCQFIRLDFPVQTGYIRQTLSSKTFRFLESLRQNFKLAEKAFLLFNFSQCQI